MLGSGRPFIFEVVGARNSDVDLGSLDARIAEVCAGRIELTPFERVARERVAYWKEGQFSKVYRVCVQAAADVDRAAVQALVGRDLEILQRTPTRVSHRRADLERERGVTVVAAGDIGDREFVLDLRCVHGTYVKEWISGDEGRTKPSLSEILAVQCTCSQLDVLDILTSPSPSAPSS
jgi:tRNA pseudouridine synthase 10